MKDKSIRAIFWAMVALFILTIVTMSISVRLARNLPVINIFLPFIIIFLVLGVILLVLTVKKKVSGITKKFLLLTGVCAVGLPVFAVMHNLITALCINFFGFGTGFDEPVFFVLATIICPLGFLAGAAGIIVLTIKKKSGQPAI
jgi:hypothetical protein